MNTNKAMNIYSEAQRIMAMAIKSGLAVKHSENVNYNAIVNSKTRPAPKGLRVFTDEHKAKLRAAKFLSWQKRKAKR